jgi:hypothetical protein
VQVKILRLGPAWSCSLPDVWKRLEWKYSRRGADDAERKKEKHFSQRAPRLCAKILIQVCESCQRIGLDFQPSLSSFASV